MLPTPTAFGVSGLTTAVWVTVHAPPNATAGRHSFTITLAPVGGSGSNTDTPIVVQAKIKVFGFALPTAPALLT
eukprot:SAG31_NODE_42991_length_269_cov_0.611765_1_plen_73_part_01